MAETPDSSLIDKVGRTAKKAHPILKDFRDFAVRGNVIDLAVGVIIGAAFGKIVDSLVTNVVMPPLSVLTGDIDFSKRVVVLTGKYATRAEAEKANAPMIHYGVFLNAVINFLIVSLTIFVIVRLLAKLHPKPAPPDLPKKDCPFCFSSIPAPATRCPQCTSALAPSGLAASPSAPK